MPNRDDSGRYDGYSLLDFICDPFFQDGIIHPEGDAAAFWQEWKTNNPEKTDTIEKAAKVLQTLTFREDFPGEGQTTRSLEEVRAKIKEHQVKRLWWPAVAVAASIALAVVGYMTIQKKATVKTTAFGEMSAITLPDSSTVVLNAHSSVRYNPGWKPGRPREVWLEGEGYFNVKRKTDQPFLVHTHLLTVEVLGTVFDIRERRNRAVVVLQEGRIRVLFANNDIEMNPGDRIDYDPATATVKKGTTIAEDYTAWKDKKLRDVTVGDVIVYLEDNYNKTIILQDPKIANKKIGGVVMFDNLDDAMFTLSTILDVKVVTHQDTLLLQHR
ncbi:MAG TPA: FecR domain-containing protein [Dinghuibacter sp.]|jgi:ferric-dicitrate binding protein FerR (iron transport regulator)|uniref:FecR family protein n=1 Tax=Dinghuibacter sp. TaxID=2024697 RepID=UPI002B650820|nr:FecR domain-containing protein [Dinghuibacter sp.]HTJ14315.1 FecR domain-containing protein [Dinghuibacter sp.]